ncbi:hypothetical protein GCM10023219_12420 [Stakelama sediminis]|uniref:Glycerophosphoryl diester phosphodiesterase membrane domain-containing protein n=1 Tax=Stakelama sediminis TaxID=463200 RepID=A0A840YWN9_9SPHN|nr:hypothetical protein [Stakelama sediminis]MBB5717967.1 hypothetical protein [Stakelama sediminis]
MLDIGAVIGAGFETARSKPKALAIWFGVYLILTVAVGLPMMSIMQNDFAAMGTGADAFASGNFAAAMMQIYGLYLMQLIVMLVLSAAIYRAVLRPQESAAGYLRLGMDELRLLGLSILFGIAWVILLVGISIVIALVAGVGAVGMGLGSNGSAGPGVLAIVLSIVLGLGSLVLMAFLGVRFALAFPLTVYRRRIMIGEAWRLSRGNFWAMLAAFIVVFIINIVVMVLVNAIGGAGYMASLLRGMSNPEQLSAASQARMEMLSHFSFFMILTWILSAVAGLLWLVLNCCGLANAARQLLGDTQEDIEAVWG